MKKETIGFRVRPEVKQEIIEKAQEMGLSISDYCESAILGQAVFPEASLTDSSLEEIADLLDDSFEKLFTRLEERLSQDEETEEKEPGFSALDFFKELPLSEAQHLELLNFVNEASTHLDNKVEQVFARMLTYAYRNLSPKPAAFLGLKTFVGDVETE